MKWIKCFLLLFIAQIAFSQADCIIELHDRHGSVRLLGLNEVKAAYPDGDQAIVFRGNSLTRFKVDENLDGVIAAANGHLVKFTTDRNVVMALSKSFIDLVFESSDGKAVVIAKHTRFNFKSKESYESLDSLILACSIGEVIQGGGGEPDGVGSTQFENGLTLYGDPTNGTGRLGGTLIEETIIDANNQGIEIVNGDNGLGFKNNGALRISPNFSLDAEYGAVLQKITTKDQEAIVRYSQYPFPTLPPLLQGVDYMLNFNTQDDASFEAMYWDLTSSGLIIKDTTISGQKGKLFFLGGSLERPTTLTPSGHSLSIVANNSNIITRFDDTSVSITNVLGRKLEVTPIEIKITGLTEYASHGAADADGSLTSGGMYQLVGDRTLYIKP
jgi:hypothetical protein